MSLTTELRAELASAHLRAQAARVLRIGALALAAQVTALGDAHLDRTALVSAAVGALEAVYRQLAPTVLRSVLLERLRLAVGGHAAAEPSATVSAPTTTQAAAAVDTAPAPAGAVTPAPAPQDGATGTAAV
jgi:hypothetical protein